MSALGQKRALVLQRVCPLLLPRAFERIGAVSDLLIAAFVVLGSSSRVDYVVYEPMVLPRKNYRKRRDDLQDLRT